MANKDVYSFENALKEFYRSEVVGEAILSALSEGSIDPIERLKLGHLLQLETETKAWLRPHLIQAGLSIAEPPEFREPVEQIVTALAPLEWSDKVRAIANFIPDLVKQYGAYAQAARDRNDTKQAEICDFMVEHERVQAEFAQLELGGAEPAIALKPLTRRSCYPLPFDL